MKRLNLLSKSIWLICIMSLTILTAWQIRHKDDSPVRSKKNSNTAKIIDQESQEPRIIFRDAHFNILGDYRKYYAEYEPLCFTAITPGSPDNYGLQLALNSNMPGLSHIEYAEDGMDYQILKNNTLFVPLDREIDVAQDKIYKVRSVFSSPQKEFDYTIHVNCMTMKAFEKAGGKRARDIIKISSEPQISFGTNKPENWRTFNPGESDIAFANKQWGHLIQGNSSDYEKARILTKALMRELREHGGMPQAFLYELPTFEKYVAITSGRSRHACAQYSEIFSMVLNCFGVINRWGFIHDDLQSDEMLIELGSSHLVTEIFDRDLNQWIFIDGRYGTLGSYLGDVGPLTLQEFLLFMNQPNRRTSLNILHYDAEKDKEQIMLADDNPKPFNSYIGWTKGFHTRYRDVLQADLP